MKLMDEFKTRLQAAANGFSFTEHRPGAKVRGRDGQRNVIGYIVASSPDHSESTVAITAPSGDVSYVPMKNTLLDVISTSSSRMQEAVKLPLKDPRRAELEREDANAKAVAQKWADACNRGVKAVLEATEKQVDATLTQSAQDLTVEAR